VLRKAQKLEMPYTNVPAIITPRTALWNCYESSSIDFLLSSALVGMLGFSGDIAGLDDEQKKTIKWYVDFYKKWRTFITASAGHLLTPVQPINSRRGLIAFQLQNTESTESIVFAFMLVVNDGQLTHSLPLRNLVPEAEYIVEKNSLEKSEKCTMTGADLLTNGLQVQYIISGHPYPAQATIYTIKRVSNKK